VRNPFEVVKQQVQSRQYASTAAALRGLLRAENGGLRGLYRGYAPMLLRDAAFSAIQMSLKSVFEARWTALTRPSPPQRAPLRAGDGSGSGDVGGSGPGRGGAGAHADAPAAQDLATSLRWYENAFAGGLAGGIAGAITTPLDTIKTRLMTQRKRLLSVSADGAAAVKLAEMPYRGSLDAAVRIVRDEGWQALFAGIRTRIKFTTFGGAVFIGVYYEVRRQLHLV
jgi:solute carrier family 25 S-adenosylmethionine transporter 26